MLLSIYKFHKNQKRKGHAFLTGVNKIAFTCILTSPESPLPPPLIHLHSSLDQGVAEFRNYCYSCNDNYQYRRVRKVTATLLSKNIMLFSLFFLRNDHSWKTVDQDQEL
jgi:hypothetical protein